MNLSLSSSAVPSQRKSVPIPLLAEILVLLSLSFYRTTSILSASFVGTASDMNPITTGDHIDEYADDTYLIIPASNNLVVLLKSLMSRTESIKAI